MKSKYSREVYLFILNNAAGRTTAELFEIVNKRFGNIFTLSSLRAFKKNNKIKSGVKTGSKKGVSLLFSAEIVDFIKEKVTQYKTPELTYLINEKFKTDYKPSQLRTYKKNNKICSGIDTRFQTGHIAANKGKKLSPETYEKIKSTMFKKGHTPDNYKQVGSERINSDGYTLIKVKEPNVWVHKHIYVWEQVHGKVPDDSIIIFLDNNKRNFAMENLVCVTKSENLRLNKSGLRSEFPEVTQAGINVVKLETKIRNKKERRNKNVNI